MVESDALPACRHWDIFAIDISCMVNFIAQDSPGGNIRAVKVRQEVISSSYPAVFVVQSEVDGHVVFPY